jgi:hypothetical protein
MLTAKPVYQSAFPRRNWTVLAHEVPIGEVTLTGWGMGSIVLRGNSYCATTMPEVGPAVPNFPIPRRYTMCSDTALIHSASEEPSRVYRIDSTDAGSGPPLIFQRTSTWQQFLFEPWPRYGIFRTGDTALCGTIIWQSPFPWQSAVRELVALTLPAEIGESLQLFLLWLFVDRAQWGRDEDATG